MIPVIPVRKTNIIIAFALCWGVVAAVCLSQVSVDFLLRDLGLSLFLDLPLDFFEISLEAMADFHCLSLEYLLDAGLGTQPTSLLSLGRLPHSIDLCSELPQ